MSTNAASSSDDAWARRVSAGVAAGSRDALETLYAARFERLFRLVRARTKCDDAFALDCAHDTWLRVVRHMPVLGTLEALDRWLARAAISAALDRMRVDASRRRRETFAAATQGKSADPINDSDTELLDQMQRELAQLSEPDRTVIDLRFRSGLSLGALGATLGIGVKAAEIRLRRALARLRVRLDQVGVRRD